MMPFPTRLGRQPCQTVTFENCHQKKYKINNPKVSTLSLPGPRNWWQQRECWPRIKNKKFVRGIRDLGTMTMAAISRWLALRIGDHDRGVGIGKWAQGIDDDNGSINWGSRIYNASEWMSLTAEAPVCLRAAWGLDGDNGGGDWGSRRYNASEWNYLKAEAPVCLRKEGIDNKHSNVGRVRWVKGLSKDDGGIGIGQGIRETNIWRQRMRQRRKASTETTTMTTYASA